jgi:hypothetical protein
MAVTAIKLFDNDSPGEVVVENKERSQTLTVPRKESLARDVWIPHCASQKDFENNHFLAIQVLATGRTCYVWQQAAGGEDLVRFTDGPPPRWQDNAPGVPGHSGVGGNRMLEIHENGGLEFHLSES